MDRYINEQNTIRSVEVSLL